MTTWHRPLQDWIQSRWVKLESPLVVEIILLFGYIITG